MKIIFFGPQGSGKGTQVELLAKKFNIPAISPGVIYRQEITKKTKLGKIAAKYLNKGELAPSDLTNEIMKNRLKKIDCKKGFILDGYPRDLTQAQCLDKITKIDLAIEIILSNKECLKRFSGRQNCICGTVYHIKFNPPKKKGICDKCGKSLFIREDEGLEAIKKRLQIYSQKTKPLLKEYQERGILIKINGNQSIKEVEKEIGDKLKVYFNNPLKRGK
ncbi:nucleoside monophosphate kinase [Candidatus Kuenenbacteria bacterium]|nr:nucleoside monophosphate kinase [Candidatus Kuenenbacteria bacterium]